MAEFVGKTVKKEFEGFGVFAGVVNSFDPSTGFFKILYEDGDSEELEFQEISSLLDRSGSTLNDQYGSGDVTAKKPRKLRRVVDSGIDSSNLMRIGCLKESGESSKETISFNDNLSLNLNTSGGDGVRSEYWLNLNDGFDLNYGLNLNDDGLDRHDSGMNSNDGFNLNVNSEQHLKKINAFIDLNLDANGDFQENLREGDLVVSVVGTQKREHCFDLNLGLDEEIKNSENGCVGQLEEIPSFHLVYGTQKQEMEGTQMRVTGRSSKHAVREPHVRLSEEVPKGIGVSLGLKRDDSSGAMYSKEFLSPEVQLKGILPDTGTPPYQSSYQGNSESTCKERKTKKRRKVQANVISAAQAVFRRSSSRVAVAPCTENKISRGAGSVAQDEVSSPGAIEAGDFLYSDVRVEKESSTYGTPLVYGYRGVFGSTGEERKGEKRRNLLDGVHSARERALRRSDRRLAPTLSDQSHVSGGARLQEPNEIHAAVHAVLEESDEYSILPSKLQLPPSSENLNLDGIPILDLFSVYTCLRSFSTLLFLSPFELEDFVSALKSNVPNLLFDSIHVCVLQTLRRHLEFLSAESSQSASNCLRSLNWDFLDLITWPMFMGEYLLTHGSKLKPEFDICKLKLLEIDYYEQPTSVKIEILRCLCDDVIEVEAIRSELNRRTMAIDLNIDSDRNMRIEASKKRISLEVSSVSCLTEEVAGEATDGNSDECRLCKMDGSLICCDGCPEAYHLKCVGVANSLLPEGDWYCPECMIDKNTPWLKMTKSIRGAELLGVDPYGRFYFSSCDYLLVSEDPCDSGASNHCYRGNDLTPVIEALKSSDSFYRPILCAISKQWNLYVESIGAQSYAGSHSPTVCLETVKGQTPTLASSEPYVRVEIGDERKPQLNSIAAQNYWNTDSEISALVNNDAVTANNSMKMENPLTSSEGSAETSEATRIQNIGKTEILNVSEIQGTIVSVATSLDTKQGKHMESTNYVNSYDFARTASSVAEELTRKSLDKINVHSTKVIQDIISSQLKAISQKATKFSWSNIQSLNAEARKERCGWCFPCKVEGDEDCFFNMNDSAPDSTNKIINLGSERDKKAHLVDVMHYILGFENRLRAFLLGPWLNPHYTNIWHHSVVKASEVASLKHFLLMLESNLRHLALSAEWVKHADSVAILGSASHVVTNSLRVSSKHGFGSKHGRSTDLESNPSSKAASGLCLFWWRGGRLSRDLFNWKVLPRSLASKAARQAGYEKIPGVLYPDSSEFANRSKYVAWRAAVETSRSVEQLALQVRELDSSIRWVEIENTYLLSKRDQFRKSIKSFKKATIRRKCIEGTVAKYLLDFGKRRFIPDIVVTHGSRFEESSSGRKKYWLEEPHVPLFLLKTFEERRIARKTNKSSSGKIHWNDRVTKKSSKKRGFSYLFAKAERLECGQCKKDLLTREAVSCKHCKGFFHKRHMRKSASAITVECAYTCPKCQYGKRAAKKGKSKLQKNTNKKACKIKKSMQLQKSKEDTVVLPLRRSARRIQIVSLQNKKVVGRKKNKEKRLKSKKYTWQRKRTRVHHSYWLNGLLLSRKSNDDRVQNFSSKVLLAHYNQLTDIIRQPKCSLCREAEFSSMLNYVCCEICGDWFHGDAIGLRLENFGNLIGFRCHKCRNRTPPVCPHLNRTDRTGILKENMSRTEEESKNLYWNDECRHKEKESRTFSNSNQLEAENEDEIQIPKQSSIRNLPMESNEHVSLVKNSIDTEMTSAAHNNTETDSRRRSQIGVPRAKKNRRLV